MPIWFNIIVLFVGLVWVLVNIFGFIFINEFAGIGWGEVKAWCIAAYEWCILTYKTMTSTEIIIISLLGIIVMYLQSLTRGLAKLAAWKQDKEDDNTKALQESIDRIEENTDRSADYLAKLHSIHSPSLDDHDFY